MVRTITTANSDRYNQSILDKLEKLAVSMETNQKIPSPQPQNYGFDDYWNNLYKQRFDKKTWQNVPFYPIEAYLFRIILQIVEFNNTDSKYFKMDPFERQKLRELANQNTWKQLNDSLEYAHSQNAEISISDKLIFSITRSLWANKIDLNFKPEMSETIKNEQSNHQNTLLIADDRTKIIEFMLKMKQVKKSKKLSIVCDNSGSEFLADLMLCDVLLHYGFVDCITLHLKLYPFMVSDVTRIDFDRHLSHLYVHSLNESFKALKGFYLRICEYLKGDRLKLSDDHFWNSSESFDKLKNGYFNGDFCVIFKGDANYRRLVLCKMWDATKPFKEVISSYFEKDVSMMALRTMKSDAICGIDKETLIRLENEDKHWRHNGKRAVIQFYT